MSTRRTGEPRDGSEHFRHETAVVDRCHQHRRPGRQRQARRPLRERLLEAGGERDLHEPYRRVVLRGPRNRQLDERERVAGSRRQHPVTQARRKPDGLRVEQPCRVIVSERPQRQLRKAGVQQRQVVVVTRRDQHHDRLAVEAARHERQHLGGRPVQSVGILHEQQHRSGIADQLQDRQRDGELARRLAGLHPQGDANRRSLRLLQPVDIPQPRAQQLVEAGIRHGRLGLHARRRQRPYAVGRGEPAA